MNLYFNFVELGAHALSIGSSFLLLDAPFGREKGSMLPFQASSPCRGKG